jgi:hypothetical protein
VVNQGLSVRASTGHCDVVKNAFERVQRKILMNVVMD